MSNLVAAHEIANIISVLDEWRIIIISLLVKGWMSWNGEFILYFFCLYLLGRYVIYLNKTMCYRRGKVWQRNKSNLKKKWIYLRKLYMSFWLSFYIFLNVRKALFYRLYGYFAFVVNLTYLGLSSYIFSIKRG